MRRSSLGVAHARLSHDHWEPILKVLGWELNPLGDDAPRLLADPFVSGDEGQASAVLTASRWIAMAIVLGSVLVTAGLVLL